ncbi:MAG: peptide ABC transporter permease [Nitrospirae bacterium CG_4_10_14_3_um_filter_44_29]|nr:ABC transporter permease [Nitrospirota bacterium]OIO29642.1 MAG: peptide ABC transporter permease [Nitrospirae bacterium CG1_02_44_142]PIP71268.1 MAG: peptide ABC transporter permease [Nitrospirae bacterium CG22_combo_CG10-13_8_21_14_all_44_11]PIV43948.1 MAG: peptide ABC transporter permease [Nitrospirae bacterium CG02_land_8_20_14_3_00_44_33]PIV67050.1 MAG: peptide ABC transporter permease [Nitrospirae bacterium CG01_land_8_20_14_3_00_44_22]PIX89621.1 MAG: peptide ABC transporter permease 
MKGRPLRNVFWRRFKRNRLAAAGGVVVLLMFFAAVFAPFISPHNPDDIDRKHVLEAPSLRHPLGTDDLGRDVSSRVIWGARISLSVGFVAVGIAALIGIMLGAVSGYYGGWIDRIIMRFIDVMLSIPTFFLILAVIAFIEPSIWNIMIVIGLTSWMGMARLVRAEVLSLKEREFVLAAKALGAGDANIIVRHIMINSMAPVFVSAVLGIAGAVLIESALSFLGIGVQPPTPSWGNILTLGKDNIEIAWWLSVFPGLAILITVLSYNLVGEGLRDALDPRLWDVEI